MKSVIKLKIADVIIEFKSKFEMYPLTARLDRRFTNFIYKGKRKPDIELEITMADKLPKINKGNKRIFLTRHPESKEDNWALFKNNGSLILKSYVRTKAQHAILSRSFNRGKIYIERPQVSLAKWKISDIIYDSLQIILISYLSKKNGVFVHAFGLKDIDACGILFAGISGQGKSTTARLWHKYSRVRVLGDDRIIIKNHANKFSVYGSPWHGTFYDYLFSKIEQAHLRYIFLIQPARDNFIKPLTKREAFNLIYPCFFPVFWDRRAQARAVGFLQNLIENVPCFRFYFKDDKRIVKFIRDFKKEYNQ